MSTLSSANVTDVHLILKEHTHMRLCINMLIFTHNLGNWLICVFAVGGEQHPVFPPVLLLMAIALYCV